MTASPTLLDLMAEPRRLRDVGIDRVTGANLDWAERADRAIAFLASSGQEFGPDDVREIVGDPDRHQAMGARFMAAVKRKQIIRVGWASSTRPSCHAHRGPTYRGVA